MYFETKVKPHLVLLLQLALYPFIRSLACSPFGFDPLEIYGVTNIIGGYGLYSMKERVEICNGEFRIESVPGKGTTIPASIPTT
jgi:two-component system sensor histidine kinase DegS